MRLCYENINVVFLYPSFLTLYHPYPLHFTEMIIQLVRRISLALLPCSLPWKLFIAPDVMENLPTYLCTTKRKHSREHPILWSYFFKLVYLETHYSLLWLSLCSCTIYQSACSEGFSRPISNHEQPPAPTESKRLSTLLEKPMWRCMGHCIFYIHCQCPGCYHLWFRMETWSPPQQCKIWDH